MKSVDSQPNETVNAKIIAAFESDAGHEFNREDPSLQSLLDLLTTVHAQMLQEAVGKARDGDRDKKTYIDPVLACENESKDMAQRDPNYKGWRVVLDMPTDMRETYMEPSMLQICSGAPSYHRLILQFYRDRVDVMLNTKTVEASPDLSRITSESGASLQDIKTSYDEMGVQRIAVLGAARVFPEEKNLHNQLTKSALTSQLFLKHIESSMQNVIDAIEFETILVNGGWAGLQENSTGLPLISQVYGALIDHDEGYCFPPVTIMPAGGAYDRVVTREDIYKQRREVINTDVLKASFIKAQTISKFINDAENFKPPLLQRSKVQKTFDIDDLLQEINESKTLESDEPDDNQSNLLPQRYASVNQEVHTYFEVPGVWGDDSKYLLGFSTGALVFEPYGYWTNIEIANGVAQGKAIAVIASPDTLTSWHAAELDAINKEGYAQIEIPSPAGSEVSHRAPLSYRLYIDAATALQWIAQETQHHTLDYQSKLDIKAGLLP